MSNLEMLLSLLLTQNPANPVILHIDGDIPEKDAEKFMTTTLPSCNFRRLVEIATKYEVLKMSYHTNKYGIDSDVQKAVFGPSHYKEDKDDA